MNRTLSIALAVGISLLLASSPKLAAEESVAQQIATAIVKGQALQFLKDRTYEVKQSQFEAVAKPVDPEKHLKLTIRDFELLQDSVVMSASMRARFSVSGKIKSNDAASEFKATADIDHLLSIEARLHELRGETVIEPRVKDIEFEVEVVDLEPSEFPGGKETFKKYADSALKHDREKILGQINRWLARRKITRE